MYKTRQLQTAFWSSDVEKLHAAVAKNTFASENLTKLRQMLQNWGSGSVFCNSDVEKMYAFFEVKIYKSRQLRTIF